MTPIAMVFDELKDYLSESDLSLDYKIARSRSKKKKVYRNSRIFGSDNTYKHQGNLNLEEKQVILQFLRRNFAQNFSYLRNY